MAAMHDLTWTTTGGSLRVCVAPNKHHIHHLNEFKQALARIHHWTNIVEHCSIFPSLSCAESVITNRHPACFANNVQLQGILQVRTPKQCSDFVSVLTATQYRHLHDFECHVILTLSVSVIMTTRPMFRILGN